MRRIAAEHNIFTETHQTTARYRELGVLSDKSRPTLHYIEPSITTSPLLPPLSPSVLILPLPLPLLSAAQVAAMVQLAPSRFYQLAHTRYLILTSTCGETGLQTAFLELPSVAPHSLFLSLKVRPQPCLSFLCSAINSTTGEASSCVVVEAVHRHVCSHDEQIWGCLTRCNV